MTNSIVELREADWPLPSNLDMDSANKLANLLLKDSALIKIAEILLKIICSKYRSNVEWKSDLEHTAKRAFKFECINYNPEFTKLLFKCFKSCTCIKQYERMKGLIPEKYVELVYGIRYSKESDYDLKFGCNVIINKNIIKFYDEEMEKELPDSGRRQSIDIAAWNNKFGDFIEVKYQPDLFEPKNIYFMRLISDAMKKQNLSYYNRFYTWDDINAVKIKLRLLGCWNEEEIDVLVYDEINKIPTVSELNKIA